MAVNKADTDDLLNGAALLLLSVNGGSLAITSYLKKVMLILTHSLVSFYAYMHALYSVCGYV